VVPPGWLDNVNTRLLIPSHALPPTFSCAQSGLDFVNAQKLDFVTREKRDCANAAKLLMSMTFAARR
jgi:hypothetical protein